MSTDPAHSLGDSFNITIGNKLTPIVENVWGLEIDANQLYEQYLEKNKEVIKEIANRGTIFDREDIESFFHQTLPGIDEVMAIIKIADLVKAAEYDLIILDTAPTGHTMVLLSLPEQLDQFTDIMDMMMDKYHYMLRRLTRRDKRDECDEYIATQREEVRRVRSLLGNTAITEFVPVTIPEPMSISETEKALQTLKGYNTPVNSIIVNRVVEQQKECPFCSARWTEKESYMREIEEKFAPYNLVRVPLFPYEIRGLEKLTEYAQILFGEAEYKPALAEVEPTSEAFPLPRGNLTDLLERNELDFVIFGGKGGVGKTSVACASALYLSRHKPDKKVLVFSTDPAHALSDSFKQPIGNEITPILGASNLYALEMNSLQLLEEFKQDYRDSIEEAFEKFLGGSGVDIVFDREIIQRLIDVIPPGVEELMCLGEIMDLRKRKEFDLYVMDSAASGHLIRFLQLPHIIKDWLKAIFRLLIKYRGVVKLVKVTESLLDLSRDIRNILDTLSNPQKTKFVMITIPEEMGIAEMGDLASSVANLNIPSSHTIVNMIIPPTDCAFCTAKRREQQKYIQEIKKKVDHAIVPIPLAPHDVRGLENLSELAGIMFEG
jgi:arsenite-transporting ATPase